MFVSTLKNLLEEMDFVMFSDLVPNEKYDQVRNGHFIITSMNVQMNDELDNAPFLKLFKLFPKKILGKNHYLEEAWVAVFLLLLLFFVFSPATGCLP